MTKDPKLTRITDSASSGMEESMATEIRSTKWTASEPLDYDAHSTRGFIEVSAPNDACFTALFPLRKDAEDYIAWKESGPECSRLASRVEELEKGLAKRFDAHEWEGYRDVAICLVLGYCGFQQCQCGLPNIWERNGDKAYEMAESALAKHKEKK